MPPPVAIAVLVALVAATAGVGLLLARTGGRLRPGESRRVSATDLGGAGAFGVRATLVQLSAPGCARCPGTARLLGDLAAGRPGVAHLEVDLAAHPSVADRFDVLQTPTVLLLDAERRVRARIGGAPRRDDVVRGLEPLLEASDAR